MVEHPFSPVRNAAIPTTTKRAYELIKQGGGRESSHVYEMVGATSPPAGNLLHGGLYEIPSLPAVPSADHDQ